MSLPGQVLQRKDEVGDGTAPPQEAHVDPPPRSLTVPCPGKNQSLGRDQCRELASCAGVVPTACSSESHSLPRKEVASPAAPTTCVRSAGEDRPRVLAPALGAAPKYISSREASTSGTGAGDLESSGIPRPKTIDTGLLSSKSRDRATAEIVSERNDPSLCSGISASWRKHPRQPPLRRLTGVDGRNGMASPHASEASFIGQKPKPHPSARPHMTSCSQASYEVVYEAATIRMPARLRYLSLATYCVFAFAVGVAELADAADALEVTAATLTLMCSGILAMCQVSVRMWMNPRSEMLGLVGDETPELVIVHTLAVLVTIVAAFWSQVALGLQFHSWDTAHTDPLITVGGVAQLTMLLCTRDAASPAAWVLPFMLSMALGAGTILVHRMDATTDRRTDFEGHFLHVLILFMAGAALQVVWFFHGRDLQVNQAILLELMHNQPRIVEHEEEEEEEEEVAQVCSDPKGQDPQAQDPVNDFDAKSEEESEKVPEAQDASGEGGPSVLPMAAQDCQKWAKSSTMGSSMSGKRFTMVSSYDELMGKVNALIRDVREQAEGNPGLESSVDELMKSLQSAMLSRDPFKVKVHTVASLDAKQGMADSSPGGFGRRKTRRMTDDSYRHLKVIQDMCDSRMIKVTSRKKRPKPPQPPTKEHRERRKKWGVVRRPSNASSSDGGGPPPLPQPMAPQPVSSTSPPGIPPLAPVPLPVLGNDGSGSFSPSWSSGQRSNTSTMEFAADRKAANPLPVPAAAAGSSTDIFPPRISAQKSRPAAAVDSFDCLPRLVKHLSPGQSMSRDFGATEDDLNQIENDDWQLGESALRDSKIRKWNFRSYPYNEYTNGHALIGAGMLFGPDLIRAAALPVRELRMLGFLRDIERSYRPTPYHNSVHAADVLNSTMFFLKQDLASLWPLGPIARLAGWFSAIIHDVGHFGRNNRFHVMQHHALAVIYNDMSPLENMHAATGFLLLQQPHAAFLRDANGEREQRGENGRDRNQDRESGELARDTFTGGSPSSAKGAPALPIKDSHDSTFETDPNFSCTMPLDHSWMTDEEFTEFRKLVVEAVLTTDMSKHFETSARFKAAIGFTESDGSRAGRASMLGTAPISEESDVDRATNVISMYLKAADIGHAAKSLVITREMTLRIHREFFTQGDEERALGLDISPLCDRNSSCIPKSQVGFLHCLVLPLYTAVNFYLNSDEMEEECIAQINDNIAHWDGPDPCVTDADLEHEEPAK